jgi:hypothetical protein
MTSKHDLHHLIDELPQSVLGAAEAFLAFLHSRSTPSEDPAEEASRRTDGKEWADSERRGLATRAQHRIDAEVGPDSDGLA